MMTKYETQNFTNGKILTADNLKNIENGLSNIENNIYKSVTEEGYEILDYSIVKGTTFRIDGKDTPYESYNRTDYISVNQGDNIKIVCAVGSKLIPGLILFDENKEFISYQQVGTGTLMEYEIIYVVPNNVKFIIAQTSASAMGNFFVGKYYKETTHYLNFYTKGDTSLTGLKYGTRWNIDNPDDMGERVFDSVGLNACISIASTQGYSDFDNIYPWCLMKRCNIKKNANGATIITYEGDTDFALDGSNGDVFVRIPKFYYERYIEDNYEYRVVSQSGTNVHPAFVEDGRVLDEIFISAFEGKVIDDKLRSYGNVLPSMNITGENFLIFAQNNGIEYSLYDSRCVDLLFTLMCVEYGCRNSNKIIGWGIADYFQNVSGTSGFQCILPQKSTNIIRTRYHEGGLNYIHVGDGICICGNNDQSQVLTHALLTHINIPEDKEYIEFTFDGDPIDVDETCFFGSGPMSTNWCETCDNPLLYHTGRSDIQHESETRNPSTFNPIRYRWIENPVGNVWHFLPDVTFNDLQMYVCHNMRDYVMGSYEYPYEPLGNPLLDIGNDNGHKGDVVGYNYWITKLFYHDFSKGISFGKEYDKQLTSGQAFGAYYYLTKGTRVILNGGGYDHLWRCNMLTNRAWQSKTGKWYLYGARLMYKHIQPNIE